MRKINVLLHYLNYHAFIRMLLIIFVLVTVFGSTMRLLEPDNFTSLFDSIYWAIVTAATIGYGDFVPQTVLGKILTVIFILVGTAFTLYYFTQIAAYTIQAQNKERQGMLAFIKKGHIVIIGWNERSKNLIQDIRKSDKNQEIVLIDHTLPENPYHVNLVYFIKGQGFEDHTLELANVEEASCVIITSDHHLVSELQADMQSIMTLLAVRGMNQTVHISIELLTPEQRENAKRAGADEIIETSYIISLALFNKLK
jgi:voltage-gated potassium channel